MKHHHLFAAAGMAALLSTTALAAGMTIKSIPDEGTVTLRGTVDSVNNAHEFTLRDNTGTIDVDINPDHSVVLKKGDEVTVTGSVDKDVTGKDINASNVEVSKGLVRGASDAVKSIPGVSTTSAQAFNIRDLPDRGMVKVSGTVSDVDNEKEFTLKDETGSINVDIESNERAALAEGAKVTVIGHIDSGLLGKDIKASQVIVTAGKPTASR